MSKKEFTNVQRSSSGSKRSFGIFAISIATAIVLGCGGGSHASTARQPEANAQPVSASGQDAHREVCHAAAVLTDAVDGVNQVAAKRGVTSAELRAQLGDDLVRVNTTLVTQPIGAKADDVKLYEQARDYQLSLSLVASYFKGESTDGSVLGTNSAQRKALVDHWDAVCP